MKKKNGRTKGAAYWNMAATTTARDWGFKPVPGKGGKTTNYGNPQDAKENAREE